MSQWHEATSLAALTAAARRAARGKVERPAVARFMMDAERECLRLQQALRLPVDHPDAWWPEPPELFTIRDPKPRLISVAPFRDRVVHQALCAVLEPAFERYSIHHSYACWKGKGQHRALRQCQRFARAADWAFKGDVASFFASVPHDRLLVAVRRLIGDVEICDRVERVLAGPRPGLPSGSRGLPIGALTSQHLANFYLGALDHWLTDGLGFGRYLRYMDDFIVFGERDRLRQLRHRLRDHLAARLDLRLNERQSRVQPVRDGIRFLGFRVFRGQIRVSADRWRRFRQAERALEAAWDRGELDEEDLGRSSSSRYAHLEAFDTFELRRSHLRRCAERRGRGRTSFEPRHSRRFLEEQPGQRACREPQEEPSLQPQRQRGFSRGELNAAASGEPSRLAGTDRAASRSRPLRPGIDPTPVPRSGLVPGTEPPQPGGGTLGVAAGLLPGEGDSRAPR